MFKSCDISRSNMFLALIATVDYCIVYYFFLFPYFHYYQSQFNLLSECDVIFTLNIDVAMAWAWRCDVYVVWDGWMDGMWMDGWDASGRGRTGGVPTCISIFRIIIDHNIVFLFF